VKLLLRLALLALLGFAGYLIWKQFAGRDEVLDTGPSPRRISERAELTPEEWAAGSDDPVAQATAILAESDERFRLTRDDEGIERRRSEDTVDP
jgi:hypothetical protein